MRHFDRMRARFVAALGLSLLPLACEKKDAQPDVSIPASTAATASAPTPTPTPSPSPSPTPPPSSLATTAAPTPTAALPAGCAHAKHVTAARESAGKHALGFADCPNQQEGRCCGPAGGSVRCARPFDEPETRRARMKGGEGADACCYVVESGPCEGRPLRDGDARVVARVRGAPSEPFARAAADEHASIAAFSILSLQLLALGAPAELVAAAHRAALDEVEHARLCLELARARAGEAVELGALRVPAFREVDLATLAVESLVDGCVGEAAAALRAREAASIERDPRTRAALERIADDEERHAELGWKIVAWAVAAGGEPVVSALRRAMQELARAPSPLVCEVVLPCAELLFSRA